MLPCMHAHRTRTLHTQSLYNSNNISFPQTINISSVQSGQCKHIAWAIINAYIWIVFPLWKHNPSENFAILLEAFAEQQMLSLFLSLSALPPPLNNQEISSAEKKMRDYVCFSNYHHHHHIQFIFSCSVQCLFVSFSSVCACLRL